MQPSRSNGMMALVWSDNRVLVFNSIYFYWRRIALLFIAGCVCIPLFACNALSGKSLTLYQVPAAVLDAFKELHPLAHDPEFIESYKKGVRVYRVRYIEGEEEHDLTLNAYGKPIVPKAKLEDQPKAEEEKSEDSPSNAEAAAAAGAQVPAQPVIQNTKTLPAVTNAPSPK